MNDMGEEMLVRVRVSAGARREQVEEKDGMLMIAVKEPAAGNSANARIREIVAKRFGVGLSAVRIANGHHKGSKLLRIIRR